MEVYFFIIILYLIYLYYQNIPDLLNTLFNYFIFRLIIVIIIVILTFNDPLLGVFLALAYVYTIMQVRDKDLYLENFVLSNNDIKLKKNKYERIKEKEDKFIMQNKVETNQKNKKKYKQMYNIKAFPQKNTISKIMVRTPFDTYTGAAIPLTVGDGYNFVPSNLLRQAMNISGVYYK